MARKKILVFQHVAYEILGTLDPLLRGAGFRIRYVNFGRHPEAHPDLEGYSALVVLGGPVNVDQTDRHPHLLIEASLIREALDRGLAVLGICLGAQLLAKALSARIQANPVKEIGWHDLSSTAAGRRDPLMSHFRATERIFQWHGDTFDIPAGAIHLASSPNCPNQAFRYGDNAYGFQFHLEADQPLIHRWLSVPAFVRELESLQPSLDPESIRRETQAQIARTEELSDRTFGEFIKIIGPRRRRRVLPSR